MDTKELRNYFHRECKFKLRSGKEIYGVIWEVDNGLSKEHFFATAYEHKRYLRSQNQKELQQMKKYPVNLEDIIGAENLAN